MARFNTPTHYKRKHTVKITSPSYYLEKKLLDELESVASFYNVSLSCIVCASIDNKKEKDYEKAISKNTNKAKFKKIPHKNDKRFSKKTKLKSKRGFN